jgi:3-oxoacyl-[acyl-carrier protein] reductase
MSARLNGKVAIVTGAASGQGAEAARLFASEGAQVAALDLNAEGLATVEQQSDGNVTAVECDVSDSGAVRAAIDRTLQLFGSINVLYNNAGVLLERHGAWDESRDGPIADITEELFDKVIGINLKSQFLMCKYALPHMLQSGAGSIINTASVSGAFIGTPNGAYCASKGGVVGLTRSLAVTYGTDNIRANVVCPGYIATPMIGSVMEQPGFAERAGKANPLGRVGQPSEIASTALFLASDESSYINGAVITVDGGGTSRGGMV